MIRRLRLRFKRLSYKCRKCRRLHDNMGYHVMAMGLNSYGFIFQRFVKDTEWGIKADGFKMAPTPRVLTDSWIMDLTSQPSQRT